MGKLSRAVENTGDSSNAVENKKSTSKYPDPTPDPELLARLAEFEARDAVEIEYDVKDFNFFLTDIRPRLLKISGKLLSKQRKPFKGNNCEYAVILDRRGNTYPMLIPYEDTKNEKGLSEDLSKLKVGDTVEASGLKQGGVYRLKSIAEGEEPRAKPAKKG